jgi:hypothetical protein
MEIPRYSLKFQSRGGFGLIGNGRKRVILTQRIGVPREQYIIIRDEDTGAAITFAPDEVDALVAALRRANDTAIETVLTFRQPAAAAQ